MAGRCKTQDRCFSPQPFVSTQLSYVSFKLPSYTLGWHLNSGVKQQPVALWVLLIFHKHIRILSGSCNDSMSDLLQCTNIWYSSHLLPVFSIHTSGIYSKCTLPFVSVSHCNPMLHPLCSTAEHAPWITQSAHTATNHMEQTLIAPSISETGQL